LPIEDPTAQKPEISYYWSEKHRVGQRQFFCFTGNTALILVNLILLDIRRMQYDENVLGIKRLQEPKTINATDGF